MTGTIAAGLPGTGGCRIAGRMGAGPDSERDRCMAPVVELQAAVPAAPAGSVAAAAERKLTADALDCVLIATVCGALAWCGESAVDAAAAAPAATVAGAAFAAADAAGAVTTGPDSVCARAGAADAVTAGETAAAAGAVPAGAAAELCVAVDDAASGEDVAEAIATG